MSDLFGIVLVVATAVAVAVFFTVLLMHGQARRRASAMEGEVARAQRAMGGLPGYEYASGRAIYLDRPTQGQILARYAAETGAKLRAVEFHVLEAEPASPPQLPTAEVPPWQPGPRALPR